MLWVCLSSARTRELCRIKINGIELSTGKILEETWFSLLSNRHWETNSPNSRKIQRQKYTGVAYQEDVECS